MTEDADQPIINFASDRVALGPLRRELISAYQRWRNDFTVQRTFGDMPKGVTLEERTAWYEEAAVATDAYWFTIYDRSSMTPIGLCDLFEVDWRNQAGRFGMLIGESEYRGKGLGTETARLMLDYAFTAVGLFSVWLDVDEFNVAGRRAYERAGFRECGRWRGATLMNGRRYDRIIMDAIASEFESPVLGSIFQPDLNQ
jgi:diamine N-acetyltransferase